MNEHEQEVLERATDSVETLQEKRWQVIKSLRNDLDDLKIPQDRQEIIMQKIYDLTDLVQNITIKEILK